MLCIKRWEESLWAVLSPFFCGLGDFFGIFAKILKKEAENFEKYLAKGEEV